MSGAIIVVLPLVAPVKVQEERQENAPLILLGGLIYYINGAYVLNSGGTLAYEAESLAISVYGEPFDCQ